MRAYKVTAPLHPAGFETVEAEAKRAARNLDGELHPLEIDTTKAALIPFLNKLSAEQYHRGQREALGLHDADEPQLASEGEKPWILGPPTKDPPVITSAFLGDLKAAVEFVPITKAAALDLNLDRCPVCRTSALAALQAEHVIAWVRGFASLDDLQLAAEAIRAQVSELGEQLDERTVQ